MNSYSFIIAGILAFIAILTLGYVFILKHKDAATEKISPSKSTDEERKNVSGVYPNSLTLFLIHWLSVMIGGFCTLLLACVWFSKHEGNNIGNLFSMPILLGIILFSFITLIFTTLLRNRESYSRSLKRINPEENH